MQIGSVSWTRLKEWNERLLKRDDFRPVMYTDVRVTAISDAGWNKLRRLREKAVRNLSILENEAGKRRNDEEDIQCLRLYYRQYKNVMDDIDEAMRYIEDVMRRRQMTIPTYKDGDK